jgi:hypothetical protein
LYYINIRILVYTVLPMNTLLIPSSEDATAINTPSLPPVLPSAVDTMVVNDVTSQLPRIPVNIGRTVIEDIIPPINTWKVLSYTSRLNRDQMLKVIERLNLPASLGSKPKKDELAKVLIANKVPYPTDKANVLNWVTTIQKMASDDSNVHPSSSANLRPLRQSGERGTAKRRHSELNDQLEALVEVDAMEISSDESSDNEDNPAEEGKQPVVSSSTTTSTNNESTNSKRSRGNKLNELNTIEQQSDFEEDRNRFTNNDDNKQNNNNNNNNSGDMKNLNMKGNNNPALSSKQAKKQMQAAQLSPSDSTLLNLMQRHLDDNQQQMRSVLQSIQQLQQEQQRINTNNTDFRTPPPPQLPVCADRNCGTVFAATDNFCTQHGPLIKSLVPSSAPAYAINNSNTRTMINNSGSATINHLSCQLDDTSKGTVATIGNQITTTTLINKVEPLFPFAKVHSFISDKVIKEARSGKYIPLYQFLPSPSAVERYEHEKLMNDDEKAILKAARVLKEANALDEPHKSNGYPVINGPQHIIQAFGCGLIPAACEGNPTRFADYQLFLLQIITGLRLYAWKFMLTYIEKVRFARQEHEGDWADHKLAAKHPTGFHQEEFNATTTDRTAGNAVNPVDYSNSNNGNANNNNNNSNNNSGNYNGGNSTRGQESSKTCANFARFGKCKFGNDCRFRHERMNKGNDDQRSNQINNQQDDLNNVNDSKSGNKRSDRSRGQQSRSNQQNSNNSGAKQVPSSTIKTEPPGNSSSNPP